MGCCDSTFDAAIGHQLGHAAVEHVALAAALAELLVQQREAGLHVADAAGQAGHQADISRREILRQAGLFQALAPGPPGGAEVLFGLVRAAGGRVGVLPGRRVPGIQRGQVFQGRQFPLGRGQPAGHRSAAAGKLVVQHGPLVLGLLDLHLQQPQLVLALFKLLVVGTLHGELASTAPTAINSPTAASVQKPVPVHDGKTSSPSARIKIPTTKITARTMTVLTAGTCFSSSDLGLFLQFLLVAGHLLQPLVELHAAAKLVDEVAGLFGGRGEIGGLALAEGRGHLFVDAGGRLVGVLGLALEGLALLQAFAARGGRDREAASGPAAKNAASGRAWPACPAPSSRTRRTSWRAGRCAAFPVPQSGFPARGAKAPAPAWP